jgi:methylenetetrahydrofolate reductase (NADPH)
MKAGTNLERILESGRFAVTAEAGPPKSGSAAVLERKSEPLRTCCDAVNVTDNQTAIVRMSSLAGCEILRRKGIEPVMQMVCRDRNRIAIQSDILGAVGLGIGNLLCLSGDHQQFGNHPTARGVFDIDSMQLIQTVKKMRDEKKFLNDEDISGEIPVFIGAAANPFADPFEFRVMRLAKKADAGADFIQTQGIFDMGKYARWMEMVTDQGLHERTHILGGVIPIRSAGMARYMRDYVPGIEVPDEVVTRMEDADDAKAEGVNIALETIEALKETPGVHGVHIMAVGWEDILPELTERAGLLPRPVL